MTSSSFEGNPHAKEQHRMVDDEKTHTPIINTTKPLDEQEKSLKEEHDDSTAETAVAEDDVEQHSARQGGDDDDDDDDTNSDQDLEKWNSPPINRWRFAGANLGLFIMGMNDASVGALIPYIEPYYNVNYTKVSTLFVVPFVGYLIAGLTNNFVHHRFGQRGVAFLGSVSRLAGYIPMACHPRPFAILPCMLLFSGYGQGIEDSAWNAWIGGMSHANELLGILHGFYGLGATVAPLIASAMVTKAHLPWYTFYYIMIGIVGLEFVYNMIVFARADGAAYRAKLRYQDGQARTTTRAVLSGPVPWLVAVFLFGYVGVEVSLGGWIVTFMLKVRHAQPFLAGLTVTLFWLGLTIGRVTLGFVTGRIGERLAIIAYILVAIVFQLLYWLVPQFVASVIFVMLLGYFIGPLFPGAIVAATKLLPQDQHVSAIGFAASLGGGGAAVFPFVVGVVAQSKGVEVLQPFALAMFIFILVVWIVMPGGIAKGGLEKARDEKSPPGRDFVAAFQWVKKRASRPKPQ